MICVAADRREHVRCLEAALPLPRSGEGVGRGQEEQETKLTKLILRVASVAERSTATFWTISRPPRSDRRLVMHVSPRHQVVIQAHRTKARACSMRHVPRPCCARLIPVPSPCPVRLLEALAPPSPPACMVLVCAVARMNAPRSNPTGLCTSGAAQLSDGGAGRRPLGNTPRVHAPSVCWKR